jgi:hypothetical protein
MAGIKVCDTEPINFSHQTPIEFAINPESRLFDCLITFDQSHLDFHLRSNCSGNIEPLTPEAVKIETCSSPDVSNAEIQIFGDVDPISAPYQFEASDLRELKDYVIHASPQENFGFKIAANPDIKKITIHGYHAQTKYFNPSRPSIAKKDIKRIMDKPMVVGATPLRNMDRKFIAYCWRSLTDKIIQSTGIDPGMDLDVAAIFSGIDLSTMIKSKYERETKELKIYLRDPQERQGMKRRDCAIIIGLVRSSGEFFQTAVPLDNRSLRI